SPKSGKKPGGPGFERALRTARRPRKSPRARTACARDMPGGTRSDAQGGPPLRFNVLEHQLVPEHRLVAEADADRVPKALTISRDQLPKIRKSDRSEER